MAAGDARLRACGRRAAAPRIRVEPIIYANFTTSGIVAKKIRIEALRAAAVRFATGLGKPRTSGNPGHNRGPTTLAEFRLPISALLALATTVGLFWALGTLISARTELELVTAIPRIDFSRLKADTELEEIRRVKPQIDKPLPPPSSPTVASSKVASVAAGLDTQALAPAGVDFGGSGDGGILTGGGQAIAYGGGTDRDAVPQVRIDPDYPPAARDRGIEGWVVVRFTIRIDGGTKDISVVSAKPERVFDQAAIRAIAGWKYQPKIQDGKPVERSGMMIKLKFELDR